MKRFSDSEKIKHRDYVEIGRRSQLLPSFNFSLLVSDCSDHMETRHWVSVKRGAAAGVGAGV